MLKLKGVNVLHPVGQELIDITLTVGKGEVVAVVGKNDSGKSLLGRVIADPAVTHSGEIIINHLQRQHEHEKTSFQLGYAPAEPTLEPYLTGYEQLDFFASLFQLSPNDRTKRIIELAGNFNCRGEIYRLIELLGAGNRQKISLVGSIIHDPSVVVWDEPTNHLDPIDQQAVINQLNSLRNNKASVLVITNNLLLAQEHADRIIIFDRGRILMEGTLTQLKNQTGSKTNSLDEIINRALSGHD